jgi:hypothetical protein
VVSAECAERLSDACSSPLHEDTSAGCRFVKRPHELSKNNGVTPTRQEDDMHVVNCCIYHATQRRGSSLPIAGVAHTSREKSLSDGDYFPARPYFDRASQRLAAAFVGCAICEPCAVLSVGILRMSTPNCSTQSPISAETTLASRAW